MGGGGQGAAGLVRLLEGRPRQTGQLGRSGQWAGLWPARRGGPKSFPSAVQAPPDPTTPRGASSPGLAQLKHQAGGELVESTVPPGWLRSPPPWHSETAAASPDRASSAAHGSPAFPFALCGGANPAFASRTPVPQASGLRTARWEGDTPRQC